MELNDYEIKHGTFVRETGGECTVLLKKDGRFPLAAPGKIALYGNGVRHTVRGGTGSGEVNSRHTVNIEEGLTTAGFEITTAAWLDGYDTAKKEARAAAFSARKKEAREHHQNFLAFMGFVPPEPDFEAPLSDDGDTAAYVVSRNSGEGTDRKETPGDILLTSAEIRDILACNEKYQNFILVLNVGGPVDLSPVLGVKNILVLSQLGAETGNIFADLLLGKQNPSGKLATTWAALKDYPTIGDFGDRNDTHYKEGIYVGYRYFDSAKVAPLFPFGFGLSYTEFSYANASVSLEKDLVTVRTEVKNEGRFSGKEAVEVYVSVPAGKLDEPYQTLAGFGKTGLLKPGEAETVSVSFSLKDIAGYDEETASYLLEKGDYPVRVGRSSRETTVAAIVRVPSDMTVLKTKNVLGKTGFEDWKAPERKETVPEGIPVLTLASDAILPESVVFTRSEEIAPETENLSEEDLIKLNIGAFNPKGGFIGMVGNSGFTVAGAAGQTAMTVPGFPSMVMADGPAGLRLSRRYALDSKGAVHSLMPGLPESMLEFMPGLVKFALNRIVYKPKKTDTICEQYTTSIPIGTAIAESFNTALAEEYGKIVGAEMEHFGVHLWLAPALNLHRTIRCGRNFEYYSEDPLVSGLFAGALTKGVQSFPHNGVTLKHYAFNNQEFNRLRSNSNVSERAARELYLKGFGIAVKTAKPASVMTSYNLINGKHTSEHDGLIEDILRNEYGFDGIVMTDWVTPVLNGDAGNLYPGANAARVAMGGGDLFMPGSKGDCDSIRKGLADGTVGRKMLKIHATRVLKMAKKLVG